MDILDIDFAASSHVNIAQYTILLFHYNAKSC